MLLLMHAYGIELRTQSTCLNEVSRIFHLGEGICDGVE
jgi:hypothetical protein